MVPAHESAFEPETPAPPPAVYARAGRSALTVFFLSGMLMSFPGAILPAWGYHLKDDFMVVGYYFLAMGLGILISVQAGPVLLAWKDVRTVLTGSAGLAGLSFLWLALTSPPAHWPWRMAGLVLMGISAGLLNSAAFQAISTFYEQDKAATVNLAGVMFGLGCLTTALMVSTTFYVYAVGSILLLMGLVPSFAAGLYWKARFPVPVLHSQQRWREVWADVKSPGAVMFSLLLFFQFGNEWTVAGWLTIFLVQRVGVSPDSSLMMLAAFWFSLLAGRIVAQALLSRMGHGKLLMGSATSALFGCLILIATNNRFGAWTGLLLLGGGFAMIYPLVVEKIGHRFPNYHPGFFNGIFSFGITGGLLAPWLVGYLAQDLGIWVVMAVPLIGTFMVFLLLILLWVEALLTASGAGGRG
ncbi:MAG: MFS transporter [Acidobacteriia bacterium]|nr:MFS transporter [Terriglobia bacterium]